MKSCKEDGMCRTAAVCFVAGCWVDRESAEAATPSQPVPGGASDAPKWTADQIADTCVKAGLGVFECNALLNALQVTPLPQVSGQSDLSAAIMALRDFCKLAETFRLADGQVYRNAQAIISGFDSGASLPGAVPQAASDEPIREGSSMPVDMAQAKRWIAQLRERVDTLLGIINQKVPAVTFPQEWDADKARQYGEDMYEKGYLAGNATAAVPRDAGTLAIGTSAGDNFIVVTVHLKTADKTTVLYCENHTLDGEAVGNATIPAAVPQAAAVPEGYALVPLEPTGAMKDAGAFSGMPIGADKPWIAADVYRAMLAAIPAQAAAKAERATKGANHV